MMRLIQLFLAALAVPHCVHSFALQHRARIASVPSSSRRASSSVAPAMCVPKEVAGAILVVGAGYLLTQGVPPAKAADMMSLSGSPTPVCIVREVEVAQTYENPGLVASLHAGTALPGELFSSP